MEDYDKEPTEETLLLAPWDDVREGGWEGIIICQLPEECLVEETLAAS